MAYVMIDCNQKVVPRNQFLDIVLISDMAGTRAGMMPEACSSNHDLPASRIRRYRRGACHVHVNPTRVPADTKLGAGAVAEC
jgi:hypothetical protein